MIPLIPFDINEYVQSGSGEFHPAKHPKMNYATQNRLAKKRKRSRK